MLDLMIAKCVGRNKKISKDIETAVLGLLFCFKATIHENKIYNSKLYPRIKKHSCIPFYRRYNFYENHNSNNLFCCFDCDF